MLFTCVRAHLLDAPHVRVPVEGLSDYGRSNAMPGAIICAVLRSLERKDSKTQPSSTHQHGDEALQTSVVVSD
jgi:hypothetical protein